MFSNNSGQFSPPPRVLATLVQNTDGSYTFTRAKKQLFDFMPSGQLKDERDLNGLTTTFAYNGSQLATVTDPAGRKLTFTWSGSNISKIVDPIGRTVEFTYDLAGNLTDVTDVNGGDTHFTYYPGHLLASVRRPNQNPAIGGDGQSTNVTYDTANRVIKEVDPLGRTTTFTYLGAASSPNGGTTTVTAPNGSVTVDQYMNGQRVATTKAVGTPSEATWAYSYDPATLGVTQVIDPNGHTTSSEYDSNGDVLQSVDALGRATVNTYDPLGDLLTSTDPMNVETTYTYDAAGNLLTKSEPLLNKSGKSVKSRQITTYVVCESPTCTMGSNQYDMGDVESVTDALGHKTTDAYDANGDLTSVTDPAGDVTTYGYNSIGWRTSSVSPLGNIAGCGCASSYTTKYNYLDPHTGLLDGQGSPRVVTDPLGHTTTYAYDADHNLTSTTDGKNQTTTYTFDDDDESVSTKLPDGSVQETSYWPDGSVKEQTDGAGNATAYAYDPLGHQSSVTDALGRTTGSVYDAIGNLLATKSPAGVTTTYTYDAAGQPQSITYSDGKTPNVTNITYNGDGERTGMTDGTGTWIWTYDSLRRLTSTVEGNAGTVGYGYDLSNELTKLTYSNGHSVKRKYDTAGRLTSVKDWLGHTTKFSYDANSNLVKETLPRVTGVTDAFSYNQNNGLTGITDANKTASLFAATYGLNADEQLASDSSSAAPNGPSYGYTPSNQLCYTGPSAGSSCPSAGSGNEVYGYDTARNLVLNGAQTQGFDQAGGICFAAPAPSTGTCGAPPTNATIYGYDLNGNRTTVTPSTGSPSTLTYDGANRETKFTNGTKSASYVYSGDGLRMSKTVGSTITTFLWDTTENPQEVLQEGANAYIYGPGGLPLEQINGSTALWLHHDQLGSTRLVTDSTGGVAATYSYSPYGQITSSTGSVSIPLLYAGQYLDSESGLYYLHARYYDPTTGQFLSQDPQLKQTRAPYSYGSGNPLNAPDPTGLGSCPDGIAIPFTDLCLDNPLNLQQDEQNFDQNSQALQSVPVVGDLVQADPFYDDLRDGIYAAQGMPVPPGQIVTDILGTALAFLPGPGQIMEKLGFEGGDGVLAGNIANWTNYRIGAVIQNNLALIENFAGGLIGAQFSHMFLEQDDSSGSAGGSSADLSYLLAQLCSALQG